VITVLACAQKLLPVKAALDVLPALAIIGPGPAITTRKRDRNDD